MNKDIVKTFYFTQEEREKLQNIQLGIINADATITGLQMFKNIFLGDIYKRLGIDGEPQKGYSKSIQYNLTEGKIVHTESPIKEEKKDEPKK